MYVYVCVCIYKYVYIYICVCVFICFLNVCATKMVPDVAAKLSKGDVGGTNIIYNLCAWFPMIENGPMDHIQL